MKTTLYIILTIVITGLSVFSYVPQMIKLIKTKSAKDLSLISWLIYDLYFMLYFVLVIIDTTSLPLVIVTITETLLSLTITCLIILYRNK